MKIDPVWLVAPTPKAPSIPTRRAFVIGAACFGAGMTVGGACGYSYGASRASDSTSGGATTGGAAAEPDLPKSGDIELDQLRWLAVKAPLDELFEKGSLFLGKRVGTYKTDAILWRGVERMSRELIVNQARQVEPMLITAIIGQIEGPAHPPEPSLQELLPALRLRRDEAKRRR